MVIVRAVVIEQVCVWCAFESLSFWWWWWWGKFRQESELARKQVSKRGQVSEVERVSK